MLSTSVEPRRTLTPRLAYALVAAVIGLSLFASGTPSPLYTTYRELWGFSPIVLTLIYATYAFGVLAALLLAGRLSDEIGRRPVLLAALGTLMATTVLFMLADSTAWLFVARGIQGVATGLALGAASAALLDLHPNRNPAQVGLTNGVVSAGGMGFGVLISATLVELAPAPRVLPYVVLLVLFAIAFAGALRMPEPVTNTSKVAPDAAEAARPRERPPPVLPRRARRDLELVDRRPVPLARPGAVGEPLPHRQPPRRRPRRLRAGRRGRRRAARVRQDGALGGRGGRLARAGHRHGRDRPRGRDETPRCSGSAR